MTEPSRDIGPGPALLSRPGLFSILTDPRAWRALTYMLFAIVTGPFLFVWAAAIAAYSLGFSLLIAAIAAALLLLASLRPLCWLEGRLVTLLLDTPMPRTRVSLAYMALRLPLGLLYFLLALVCLMLPSAFLWAGAWAVSGQVTAYPPDPFLADEPFWRGLLSGQFVHETAGKLHVHGAPGWLGLETPLLSGAIAILISILLFVPLLHLTYSVGQWHGKFAARFLQAPQASGAAASKDASAATIT